jgi:phosphoglycolate phosphatase
MSFRAIVFDLDGTLLDTLDDIAGAMNAALGELDAPLHPVEAYRQLVGQGLEVLAYKVLPEHRRDEATIAACVAAMRREYKRTWAKATKPYSGVPELLSALEGLTIKTAVLSNKADDFVKKMVAHYFSGRHFEMVLGDGGAFPLKPDPTAALHIASSMDIAPASCVFIGDSNVDMQTARNAGMFPLGVLWGFRPAEELLSSGAKFLAKSPADIISFCSLKTREP